MAMSKGKMLACGAGGVFVVAAGVLGWLLFDAYSTRVEAEEELELEVEQFRKYNSAAVFPSLKAIAAVNTNKASFAAWRTAAETFAARGDKTFPMDEAPSAFKQRLTSEVRRIGNLPGGAEGKLAAAGFFFGFEKYLGESAVLPETKDLPKLTVQLDAITHFAEIFAEAGVLEVKSVKRLEPAAPAEDEDSSRKNGKKKAKKGKTTEDDESPKVTSLDYAITILARPSAFVEALNALVQDKRFTVVKKFAFRSSADTVVDKLNAVEAALAKKDEPQGGRRRRRRFQEEPPPESTAPKGDGRLVVDPELDAPVQVDLTVCVYDFGRAAASAAATNEAVATPAADEKKEAK